MKSLLLLCLALCFGVGQAQEKQMLPLVTVPDIDLQRYSGTWFEVARLPNWFQKKCTGEVSATYTLQDDSTIRVVNRCHNASGEYEEAEGVAKLADKKGTNTKLKVRFAPRILSFLPFVWGDYWIIDLASDYSYAVIGEPSRKYLWVLSRTPVLDETILNGVLDRVRDQGYDLTGMVRTKQAP